MSRPLIIAEVGSNFRNFDDCKNSVQMSKAVGADVVKFQLFDHESLYGMKRGAVGTTKVWDGTGLPGELDPRMPGQLDPTWLPKLKEKADAAGIKFMCTAFSLEGLAIVDKYVDMHKIASSDLSYVELLKAAAKTGKPILLSTGGSSKGDVARALDVLAGADVTVMYCASAYPSRMHNLFNMDYLRETFGKPVGISDHSLDVVYAPLSAVRHHGATVIEKHFTIIPDVDTPDRPHSLDVDQFKYMVDAIRDKVKQVGHAPTPEEKDMLTRHNRRLIVTKPIKAGEHLLAGKNYGSYRSLKDDTHGLSGFESEVVNMKVAAKDLLVGDSVGPGDFE